MDLSLSSPGNPDIRTSNGNCELIEKGHIKTDAKKTHGYRLKQIEKVLIGLRDKYEYETVIRERGFSRFPKITQTLFKVVGLSDMVFADIGEIIEIPPTTIKKTLTGNGHAKKAIVAKNVRKILKLDKSIKFVTNDESDACAVVVTYLIKKGLLHEYY